MREERDRQSFVTPAWLLAAGVSYFAALLLAKDKLQLLLLAALALFGILLLRQPLGKMLQRLSAMWVMLVLAGVIHFAFRWWLAPPDTLAIEWTEWVNESLFFTSRFALFLVCGIVLGMVHAIESYVTVISGSIGRMFGNKNGGQTAALLRCAWTIVPSLRDYQRTRGLARQARRVNLIDGPLSRLGVLRSDFFAAIAYALRHADSLALGMWTRDIDVAKLESGGGGVRVASAVACGVFCILCLSILPL